MNARLALGGSTSAYRPGDCLADSSHQPHPAAGERL